MSSSDLSFLFTFLIILALGFSNEYQLNKDCLGPNKDLCMRTFNTQSDYLKSGSKHKTKIRRKEEKTTTATPLDENYHVQYETKFAFQNVDQFGLRVKYNKTENVFYGDNSPITEASHYIKIPEVHLLSQLDTNRDIPEETRVRGRFGMPYIDNDGNWRKVFYKHSDMCINPRRCRPNHVVPVEYYLFTKNNPTSAFFVNSFEDFELKSAYYNKSHSTVFLIHGWLGNIDTSPVNVDVRQALLGTGDYNIFVVDWSHSAADLDFPGRVVPDAIMVGDILAWFIRSMIRKGYTSLNKLKLIGHSLGAHIAGVAAKRIRGQVDSIVGLDPSIGFKKKDKDYRLDSADASYVQVIHTSDLSVDYPIGDVDFYVNGGHSQPGCEAIDVLSLGSCSHGRAVIYYADSIRYPQRFEAIPCRSLKEAEDGTCIPTSFPTVFMGGAHPDRRLRGVFYVRV